MNRLRISNLRQIPTTGGRPRLEFPVPDTGVVFARIDRGTGKIACPKDTKAAFQPFRQGTLPTESEPCYVSGDGAGGNGKPTLPTRID